MSDGSPKALAPDEISSRLRRLKDWTAEDDKLVRTFDFDDFVSAVRFVDRLTEIAEEQGHHPDLHVSWGKVKVELRSHAAGGITEADFRLAAAIDGLG
jgi:4a-hydroxytetrahydrobiopterin dehydratase